ncbi:MAG: glycosyltransferase, partial [Fimbriiglobus sp.]
FHGHHDDVGRFYHAADVFAFPTRLESLGLVALEAMAHGTPVLAVRPDGRDYRTASDEFIRHGETGVLATGEAGFAAELRGLIADPDRLTALGAAAAVAAHNFAWPVALDRWESLLRDVTGRPAPPPGGPSLSVIIPTFNRSGFVRNCLTKLRESGVPDLEVVVTDDGSTDDTAAAVAATNPTAKYLWHPNWGTPTLPKNRGFAASRGRYVGFLDCDDEWRPGVPARAVELLDRYPEVDLVFADTEVVNAGTGATYSLLGTLDPAGFDALPHRTPEPGFRVLDRAAFYRRLVDRNQFCTGAAIMRREAFQAAGRFDPTMPVYGEDWDLWLRLACRGTIGFIDGPPLARYTVHAGAASRGAEEAFALGHCRAVRNALRSARLTGDQRLALTRKLRRELFGYAYLAYDRGRFADARGRFSDAVRAGNLTPTCLALWFVCALPPGVVAGLRRAKQRLSRVVTGGG